MYVNSLFWNKLCFFLSRMIIMLIKSNMAAPMLCESMSIAINFKTTYSGFFFVNLRFSDNSVPLKTTGVSHLDWFICLSIYLYSKLLGLQNCLELR